jgi:undecaprenyl-diphosphatase
VLVLAWAALLLAGWAAGSAVANDHPAFDTAAATDVHGAPHTSLTDAMRAITWLGSPLLVDLVFAVALVMLLMRRSWRNALFLTLASPGTVLMVQIIKPRGPRPPLGARLTPADGSSWPSGYASGSAAVYRALLLIARRTRVLTGHRARRTLGILVAALLALIGVSRVYLGVHHPTDVLAGWLLVAGWLPVLDRTVGHAGSAQVDARER